jgi:translocation and assembly module TamB
MRSIPTTKGLAGRELDDQARERGAESGGQHEAAQGALAQRGRQYLWDDGTAVNATVQLANAPVADVLQIAGQQQKIPVTGTMAVNAKVTGTLGESEWAGRDLADEGRCVWRAVRLGDGKPGVTGQDFEASRALCCMGRGLQGSGGYDLSTKHLHGHIEGDNLVLSKFQTFAKASPKADGTLTWWRMRTARWSSRG